MSRRASSRGGAGGRRCAAVGLLLAVLVLAAGCRALTGRSVGQWADDRAVTARVKARLAAEGLRTFTRVHVDTYDGVVYLTGGVDSAAMKERAEAIARGTPNVRLVVNNLHLQERAETAPAAAPRPPRDPLQARFPLLARLELETATPGWTRYAAYDADGRRVATVFVLEDRGERAPGDLRADGAAVDHVALFPSAAAPTHVILWHVDRETVAGSR